MEIQDGNLMTQEAAVPKDLIGQIRRMIQQEVADSYRSAPLHNASISKGGITVRDGYIRVQSADGVSTVFMGGVDPSLPDGTRQPGIVIRREDGTAAMAMFDPDPDPDGPGDYKQFLALYDREEHITVSDDTASGRGLARPYIPATFYRDRFADWVRTTSTTFETMFAAWVYKQHPRLWVQVWGTSDLAGTTGEVRVLADGVPWGPVRSVAFVAGTVDFGPVALPGAHMETVRVEIQARVTSGSGGVRVEPTACLGLAS